MSPSRYALCNVRNASKFGVSARFSYSARILRYKPIRKVVIKEPPSELGGLSVAPKAAGKHVIQEREGCNMLSWALTFLVIALIAAVLGFGGIAGTASYIAQVLFFVFLVLFLISLIVPRVRPPVA